MLLPERETRILRDLIGRKIEGIYVPRMQVALPVELYLVLADREVIKIDSCSREQSPTETAVNYPQLRVQCTQQLPSFPLRDLLNSSGEIVRSVQVLDEQLELPDGYVTYTCGLCFTLMGRQAVSVVRDSFRLPGLKIVEKNILQEEKYRSDRKVRFTLYDY